MPPRVPALGEAVAEHDERPVGRSALGDVHADAVGFDEAVLDVGHRAMVGGRRYRQPREVRDLLRALGARAFTRQAEQQVYANALEQAVLADALGFDCVWAVEHHFLEGYSHCSAPEVFLTAVAAQTERIRVGHGAVVCVPEMNHPVRVAERAAALDIVSGGRLELGTARSSTWTELGGFGADPDLTKKTWDEYVRAIPKMWTQERFAYDGIALSRCPSATCCPSRCRIRTRRCGSR